MDGNGPLDPVRPINQAQIAAEALATSVITHYGPEKAPEVIDELARQAEQAYERAEDEVTRLLNTHLTLKRRAREARAARKEGST